MSRTENVELTVLCLITDGDRMLLQNRMKKETGLDIKNPLLAGVKQFPIKEWLQ